MMSNCLVMCADATADSKSGRSVTTYHNILHSSLSVFLPFPRSSLLSFPPAFFLIFKYFLPLSFSCFFDSSLLLFSLYFFSSLTERHLMTLYIVSSYIYLITLPFITPSSCFLLSSSPFFSALILSCLGLTGYVRSGCRRCLRDIQSHDSAHRLGCHN